MTDSQAKAIALKSRLMQLDRFIYGDKNVRTLLAGGWDKEHVFYYPDRITICFGQTYASGSRSGTYISVMLPENNRFFLLTTQLA